jgi:Cys-tRNA(Pro)/Cys-tRNA(Cys) deacylase
VAPPSPRATTHQRIRDAVVGPRGGRTVSGKGTPATAALDAAGLAYSIREYVHDPSVASYGLEAAAALGAEPARVHKTLVASVERVGRDELVVAIVPVDCTLDLKALALAVGGKRAVMAPAAVAERSSGYVVGGISPIGQRRPLVTVIDEEAILHDTIFVSGGRRGLDIELRAEDLATVTAATFAAIARRE